MKHLLKFKQFESIDIISHKSYKPNTLSNKSLESEIKDILCDVTDIGIGVNTKEYTSGDIEVSLRSNHKFKREEVEKSIEELKSQLSDRYDFEFISSLVGNLGIVNIEFKKK